MSNAGVNLILEDPSVHYWVKDVIKVMMTKDPVDVLNDVKLLMVVANNMQ